jgi:hypothetical protein
MPRRKYGEDKLFLKISHSATSGVIGDAEYEIFGENALRVVSTFATSGTLTVQGRIRHSSTWDNLGTLTSGGDTDEFDIGSYDYVRFNFTVAAGSTGEIAASGFFKASSAGGGGASNAFTIFQTDSGTSPTADSATDTLTLTSSTSLSVSGDSTTDTITLELDSTVSSNHTFTGIIYFDQIMDRQSTGAGTGFKSINSTITQFTHNGSAMYNAVSGGLSFIGGYNVSVTTSGAGGSFEMSTGSNTFNALRVSGDADTGINQQTTNTLTFACGATEVLTMKSTELTMALPLNLAQYATGSLPTASSFEGCVVYDSTTQTVKYSDGSTWTSM